MTLPATNVAGMTIAEWQELAPGCCLFLATALWIAGLDPLSDEVKRAVTVVPNDAMETRRLEGQIKSLKNNLEDSKKARMALNGRIECLEQELALLRPHVRTGG